MMEIFFFSFLQSYNLSCDYFFHIIDGSIFFFCMASMDSFVHRRPFDDTSSSPLVFLLLPILHLFHPQQLLLFRLLIFKKATTYIKWFDDSLALLLLFFFLLNESTGLEELVLLNGDSGPPVNSLRDLLLPSDSHKLSNLLLENRELVRLDLLQ